MAHPYVTKVTLKDGQIVLTVEFDEFMAGQSFEISGHATQNGGAFANFYDVQIPEETPDGTVVAYVKAAPLQEFKNDENVTVVLRAARVWVTVLTQPKDGPMPPQGSTVPAQGGTGAEDAQQWNNIRAVGWVSPAGSPEWNAGQPSAGGASFQAA
jgi:hypothetical protein